MPHINRIRLVNVHYNDAKSLYDDFSMEFNGKSATYDLVNSGGKSVLLLMLLQTVIPNIYLKKDRPVKNIFIGGNPKRTSHCAVEWILDEGSEYKYMLTGFCARKKQNVEESEGDSRLDIEYFNYCYFYNSYNENDIKHLPLVEVQNNEKIVMSYDKLKQYLQDMKRRGEPVEYFLSKSAYLSYIEQFGLIEAEWKLIAEINESENNIEKYFKENKTSRKLIENFLIKIIDNINIQNTKQNDSETLTDTLLELKDNLMKFRKQSDNKKEYESASELFNSINTKNKLLKTDFERKEELDKKAYTSYKYYAEKLENKKEAVQEDKDRLEELSNLVGEIDKENKRLEIQETNLTIQNLQSKLDQLDAEHSKIQNSIEDFENRYKMAKAQNEYLDYKDNFNKMEEKKKEIESISLNSKDKELEYKKYGFNYKLLLQGKIQELKRNLDELEKKRVQTNIEITKVKEDINLNTKEISLYTVRAENLKAEYDELNSSLEELKHGFLEDGNLTVLMNLNEALNNFNDDLCTETSHLDQVKNEIERSKENISNSEKAILENSGNIKVDKQNLEIATEKQEEYLKAKNSIESLRKTFNAESFEMLLEKLKQEKNNQTKQRNVAQLEFEQKNKKIELIEKYHLDIPNEDIMNLKDYLGKYANYVTTGIEEINKMDTKKREILLANNPILVYAVLVDKETFHKIKERKSIKISSENLVPIINIDVLREEDHGSIKIENAEDIIYSFREDVVAHLDENSLTEYKEVLEKETKRLSGEIEKWEKEEERINGYILEIAEFNKKYPSEIAEKLLSNVKELEEKIENTKHENKRLENVIDDEKENIKQIEEQITNIEQKIAKITERIEDCKKIQEFSAKQAKVKEKLEITKNDLSAIKEINNEKEEKLEELQKKISDLQNKKIDFNLQLEKFIEKINILPDFEKQNTIAKSFEEIENNFKALENARNSSNAEVRILEEVITTYKNSMDKNIAVIEDNEHTLEEFKQLEKQRELIRISNFQIKELEENKAIWKKKLNEINSHIAECNEQLQQKKGVLGLLLNQLNENFEDFNNTISFEEIKQKKQENESKRYSYNKEMKEIKNKIGNIEREINVLSGEVIKLEGYIQSNDIAQFEVDTKNLLESELYKIDRINKETNNIKKNIENGKINFDKFLHSIEEQIENYYIKQDILDTLENLKSPNSSEECAKLDVSIQSIIELIQNRIENIENILKNLSEYQQKFITKCYEKAETVVRDLNKLPNLSKIKINGKNINMIKLDLYEYDDDEKKKRMADYIDNIVKDLEKNPEEIKKEQISEKLSSKALVSQIINLDRASVKLYKIEDIEENSTYKNWEGDLGSDGQVNAFYFMFAVCIISYISMLTRADAHSNSRKVIIADNPFGATSAVFLWNAMFDILKENNVQLIAPGHNISKEIISKFEVNYVLKREVFNGNKNVVRIDKEISTEHDEDFMGMDYLEMEQQSLF